MGRLASSDHTVTTGRHLFVAKFAETGDDSDAASAVGTLTRYIDTEPAGEAEIMTQPGAFSLLGDGLCVGRDSASLVSQTYVAPYEFAGGTIDLVVIALGPPVRRPRGGDDSLADSCLIRRSGPMEIEGEVEARCAVGDPADGDEIDAGLGDGGHGAGCDVS